MNKHLRECYRICEVAGLQVASMGHRGRHIAAHTSKGMLIFPSTPSDHRWNKNMRALARRLARSS
jgi:hypothetical protein